MLPHTNNLTDLEAPGLLLDWFNFNFNRLINRYTCWSRGFALGQRIQVNITLVALIRIQGVDDGSRLRVTFFLHYVL